MQLKLQIEMISDRFWNLLESEARQELIHTRLGLRTLMRSNCFRYLDAVMREIFKRVVKISVLQ